MVHVLLRDRIERQVLAERQVAATFAAAGAKKVQWPDLDAELARLDQALNADPERDTAQQELRRALGLS